MKKEKLDAYCIHISEREKKAQKAERDSKKYFQTLYMEDKIGRTYEGVISGIQEYGMFVVIGENGCEGLIKLNEIGDDIYTAETNKHRIVGFNTGEKFHLGNKVFVSIRSVDLERKTIEFKLFK